VTPQRTFFFLAFSVIFKYTSARIILMKLCCRKVLLFVFIAMLLSSSAVSAVEVIQREKPVSEGGSVMSPLQGIVNFLATWWMPLVICGGVFIILMFLLKWLKTKKEKDNIFLKDYVRTVTLCKIGKNQKRIRQRPIWMYILAVAIFVPVLLLVIALITDDVSAFFLGIGIFFAGVLISIVIKLAGFFAQHDILIVAGRFGVKVIGYYLGECVTADGNRNFMLWNSRKYVFWKNSFIVKVNMNDKIRIEVVDSKTKQRSIVEHEIPKDLILEGDSIILVKGEGVDKGGYYYYPLIADEKGNIINMDLLAYARAKDVALIDTMYQQTEDFSKVQRQAINMNPNVRYIMRTKGDTITGAEEGG